MVIFGLCAKQSNVKCISRYIPIKGRLPKCSEKDERMCISSSLIVPVEVQSSVAGKCNASFLIINRLEYTYR